MIKELTYNIETDYFYTNYQGLHIELLPYEYIDVNNVKNVNIRIKIFYKDELIYDCKTIYIWKFMAHEMFINYLNLTITTYAKEIQSKSRLEKRTGDKNTKTSIKKKKV